MSQPNPSGSSAEASAIAASGRSRSGRSEDRRRISARAWLPPLGAIILLMFSHFLFGAARPMSALFLSVCLTVSAVLALALAGPRYVSAGMLVGLAAIWVWGLAGWAGPLDQASPHLAVLTGAGALWTIGYACGRQRGALDLAWLGLVWSSLPYCLYVFFRYVALSFGGEALADGSGLHTAAGLDSPTTVAVLFGLLTLIGAARVMHVIKQIDAEGVSRSETIDRLLTRGLGGALLLGFAFACLLLTGSRVGILFALAALLLQVAWDSHGILNRPHRGALLVLIGRLAPWLAAALAGLGVYLAFMRDAPGMATPGVGVIPSRIDHLQAYFSAFLQNPVFGHGLGSIGAVRDEITTLFNIRSLSAPGGPQNVVIAWLVQGGVVGLALMLAALAAMHVSLVRALTIRRQPRTFVRLAIVASVFVLGLHGLSDSSIELPSIVWLYALILGAGCGVAAAQRASAASGRPA